MEIIVEVIGELLFGFLEYINDHENVSKWIRYPILILCVLFIVGVLLGLIILGILLFKKDILAGIFVITIALLLIFILIANCVKNK